MKLNVKKLKLLKVKEGNGLTLTFDHKDTAGANADGIENFKGLIHKDLADAVQAFGIHYVILLGYAKVPDILDPSIEVLQLLEKVHISGYSLGGGEDTECIVLTGHLIGPRGKAIILNTPPELFDCAPESRYIFMDDFQAKLRVLKSEEEAYLLGTKRGEPIKKENDAQGDLFKQQGKGQKVTKMQFEKPEDKVPIGDGSGKTAYVPPADEEAMKDVKEMGSDEKKSSNKRTARKKVKQSAENPSGEAPEEEAEE